jgi:hypothetical protein
MLKKIFIYTLIILLTTFSFAQASEINSSDNEISSEELNPKTGFPAIKDKPFIVFDYGVTGSIVNRVVFQEAYKRSNFNFQDTLVGGYISMQTKHMQPLNSIIRLAGYYPLSFTFNGVPQVSKAILRGSADLFAGILFELDMWNYLRINLSPGLHAFYQYSDRFNYVHLGGGILANIELPIAKYWTIKLDGIASYDYANLGSNKNIENYDVCWQYQIDFGFRYSKKDKNKYNYLKQEL